MDGSSQQTITPALPEDVRRLREFVANITANAAVEFYHRIIQVENPGIKRDFYIQGLKMGGQLSPDAVSEVGRTLLDDTLDLKKTPQERKQLINAIDRYYSGAPLANDIEKNPGMLERVRTWEALSDIYNFHSFFMTHDIPADDPRDILLCIESALLRHNIRKGYHATVLEEAERPNHFLMAFNAKPPLP